MGLPRFHETLLSAIAHRRTLQLRYHGLVRTVEPHVYGIDRHGHTLLRCYQTAGGSLSGKLGWKLLRTDEIRSMRATSIPIEGPRPGYEPEDPVIETILARL